MAFLKHLVVPTVIVGLGAYTQAPDLQAALYNAYGITPYAQRCVKSTGVKGFIRDSDGTLYAKGGFTYKVGHITTHTGPVTVCSRGLHYGSDVTVAMGYYPQDTAVYHHVTDLGDTDKRDIHHYFDGSSKVATNRLFVGKPLDGVYEGHTFSRGFLRS